MTDARQRIDKWLVYARIVKTRALAAGLVEKGRVRVNKARLRKPSHSIGSGDVLTVVIGGHIRVLRVTATGERRGPSNEARELYTELTANEIPARSAEGRVEERE